MLRTEHLTFSYPSGKLALDDVSLSIGSGERVAVMGANGSGKSTLARIIAGLAEPTKGTLQIDIPQSLPQISRIGILFQNPDNQMVSSVVENEIAFALENLAVPMSEMEKRVIAVLRRFGIEHLRTRLTHELSGGEKQRVALASVMIADPRILILDEPDSFLDVSGKEILEAELKRLHAEQPDLIEIRITQYPDIAATYPRLMVFAEGKLAADHLPAKIFANEAFCLKAGILASDSASSKGAAESFAPSTAPGMPHSIEIKELSFEYVEDQPVIDELSFTWNRGEVVGLVGDSGSGKTTLGLLLSGPLKPGKGEILYFDADNHLLSLQTKPGWVAAVFQQPERQFFLSSCREEIAFGPKNLGRHLTESQISALMELVGLNPHEFLLRDPFTLSMGEKRRLAFATILSMHPPFIVFDEPTCGLDPAGVGKFIELVRHLKQSGIGQIVISHDHAQLRGLCDRSVSLRRM
ncbi:MAG: ATP-binding cassette domain-containing protein [bacterium]|nr:ATP-binding cassette domain-containing protein [bacterium]